MTASDLLWECRSRLSEDTRRRVRKFTDPFVGPFGSIRGSITSDRLVALTFDDGPDPLITPLILDSLAAHGMRATWFVLVDRAEKCPHLIQRMLAEGHDVGLHGRDHRRLTRIDPRLLRSHIADGVNRLAEITGEHPRWFRPPYGAQSLWSYYIVVRRCGMQVVVWSDDCQDWTQQPEQIIAQRAVDTVKSGSVLLLHDSLAADPEVPAPNPSLDRARIVELVLRGLDARGIRGVSVTELLTDRRVHLTAWFRP